MSDILLEPRTKPFTATITPPGSKSLTNRALVLAALAEGVSTMGNILLADDTRVMLDSLRRLGFQLDVDEANCTVAVHGRRGQVGVQQADLFCGNSGTTIRFLTALCCLGHGTFNLDGIERMRQRPLLQLAGLLKNLGARVEYLGSQGFPPISVHARGLAGGIARFGAAQSSQFLSAVLQICPYAQRSPHRS